MRSVNTNNFAMFRGRLVDDIKVFPNKDGSAKIALKLAVQNSYKSKDGKVGAQFIPLEYLMSAKEVEAGKLKTGTFSRIHKGDKIAVSATARTNNYVDKNGVSQYGIALYIESVTFEETKAQVTERMHQKVFAK